MKKMRVAASAAIIAILTSAGANAKPTATTKETNLRKEPTTDSEVLTLVPRGAKVEAGECSKGWCKVSYEGQDGFMIVQNLALANVRPPPGVVADRYGPPQPYPGQPYPPPPPPAYYEPYYPDYGSYYGPYAYWGWRRGWW
jgi:uncharacterized protein YraI